jgi:8-oxo-dGTP pyrophosphatase MutT (NUDIX family)
VHLEDILSRASRHSPRVLQRTEATKESAVATVLRARGNETDVLLIKRAEHERDPWSGHMAFPGGRRDPGDADLVATVVREAREELALDLVRDARAIMALDEVEAVARGVRTGLVVRPHLYVLERDVTLVPNYEVAEVVWAPLSLLRSGTVDIRVQYRKDGRDLDLPAWKVGEHTVWGLTHHMLAALLARLD